MPQVLAKKYLDGESFDTVPQIRSSITKYHIQLQRAAESLELKRMTYQRREHCSEQAARKGKSDRVVY
jgi:hypothetical protein